jgi:two-component system cell cycle sensor histidine kinase PleC
MLGNSTTYLKAIIQNILKRSCFQDSFAINYFTLSFKDATQEKAFLRHTLLEYLPVVRFLLFVAILLFLIVGAIDPYVMPNKYHIIWLVRAVAISIFILLIFLSYRKNFIIKAQKVLITCYITTCSSMVLMIMVGESPGKELYYAGLIQVFLYSSMLRVKFLYALRTISMSMLIYFILCQQLKPFEGINIGIILNNNYFLIGSALMGITIHYIQEFYQRQNFVQKTQLQEAKLSAVAARDLTEELYIEARSANEAKQQFLVVMNHELRTPLNAIIGFATMMASGYLGDNKEKYAEYSKDIMNSGNHLSEVINEILEFSKASSGILEMNEELFDLQEIIDFVLKMISLRAAQQGLRLEFEKPEDPVYIRADRRLLTQALANIVTNAVKFTPTSGTITVSLNETKTDICINVTDTGVGIAPENIERALTPFMQIENAFSRHNEGMGLGLSIVVKIVEKHGGRFILKSALGEGTTATICLPLSRLERL